MRKRLIETDEELLTVFKVLLVELRAQAAKGSFVIFPPAKIVLPAGKITGPDATAGKIANFTFESEKFEGDILEAIKFLGATMYHLVMGRSEFNDESILFDGYREPLDSAIWPVVRRLFLKKESDIAKIESMVDAMIGAQNKRNAPFVSRPLKSDAASPGLGANIRPVAEILKELEEKDLKIINHVDVATFWRRQVPPDLKLYYSDDTLEEAIKANQKGEQWMLVYYTGQSLRQMNDNQAKNKIGTPLFWESGNWWLKPKEKAWSTKTPMPSGYYLLNFTGKFADVDWEGQNKLIHNIMEPVFERAHEFVVAEAIFSNYVINGERLLENWCHWGKESDSDGKPVRVGNFNTEGLVVASNKPIQHDANLRVVIVKKHETKGLNR